MEQNYAHPDSLPRASPGYRRSSLASQISHARSNAPPLPHQPQPHFYGAPDIDLNLAPQSGMKPGERGYYFGFDQLPSSVYPGASEHVVIAGYEGGLDVYSVSKKGLEPLGNLRGLRGGVVHAKILPWTITGEQKGIFPLIAVVLHGPVLPSRNPETNQSSAAASPRLDGAASPRSVFSQPERQAINSYQTSVHVYSLKTNRLVDTLLAAPKIPISSAIAVTSPAFQPPPATGGFTIKADAGTLAVCSGTTGECWVFLQLLESQNTHLFACAGKLWTSLQQSPKTAMSEEETEKTQSQNRSKTGASAPIFALNGRWIAYCPSSPSSQIALGAHTPAPIIGRAPGVASVTPPQLPAATAYVDLISDSFVNKIMRETTQELISGAKWVGQQGLQAWNSYWNKPTGPQQPPQARSPPSQFPPTHSTPGGRSAPKEPGLVSIVDAEALPSSANIVPVSSFAPPGGCSFLSFSPSSLALFTASTKGDVQNVWDLLRIQHTKATPMQASISPNVSTGPSVRQLAQFSRMTVARIVDVAWAEPHGERLAVVTERGTVHLLEMPFSASMWPPPRRRVAENKTSETSEGSSSAVSMATGAFGAAYQAAKPFVSRSRRSSATNPTGQTTTFKESAAYGSRVVAAGISSSLGKTGTAINQFRHAGENRVALPNSSILPSASCITWVRARKSHSLFTLGDGVVRIFPNKTRRASDRRKRSPQTGKYKDLKLPQLPDDSVSPAIRQIIELGGQDEVLDLTDQDMDAGNNTLTLDRTRKPPVPTDMSTDAAIPQAEIESSAPYQPFHTDRRVTLCEYANEPRPMDMEALSNALGDSDVETKPKKKKSKKQPKGVDASLWTFGQDIQVVTLDLGIPPALEDDDHDDGALPPSAMERVMEYGDQEQIVVTTRKRHSSRQGDDGDGFFEDDCEVLDFADQRV